ncbi:unnamed protein product [Ilex paraguariensis]|uniref:BHLH domain-containing protein n=1 Tax=Ilex paraguariensis TaxID=185542 RepID=A0ABC8TS29_9AQUA
MDPPAMMNHGGFQAANVAEIWPFPINGEGANGDESGGGLGLRRVQFSQSFGDASGNRDVSVGDPMVLDQRTNTNGGGARKRREEEESAKGVSTSSGNGMNDFDMKRLKTSGSRDENHESKAEVEAKPGKAAGQNAKPADPPKQDYIHVRARRGQATDSHSLAERARREKISERMKILQDLVPGCTKVIGKALVLDEIINYIQSLQHQVEFLSMKLEAVNTRMNPSIEAFPLKDFGQQAFDTASMPFGSQATREYGRASSPDWLHMQIGGGFEKTK